MVGEASISLATACYGTSINGNSGHDDNDVLFLAFPGSDAVPGKSGAKWTASNYDTFEASIKSLGDTLIGRLGSSSSGGGGTTTTTSAASTATCSWEGHCAGKTRPDPTVLSSNE